MSSLIDLVIEYACESDTFHAAYNMMGKLLDKDRICSRMKVLEIDNIYIYGGGYLGIQFYNAIKDSVNVKAIVDSSGKLKYEIEDAKSMNIESFRQVYDGEKVVITPIQYYEKIYDELISFVDKKKLMILNEIVF